MEKPKGNRSQCKSEGKVIMYVDHFKAYQDIFGQVVEQMEQKEKQWKQASILNMIELALMTKDREWFMQLVSEL